MDESIAHDGNSITRNRNKPQQRGDWENNSTKITCALPSTSSPLLSDNLSLSPSFIGNNKPLPSSSSPSSLSYFSSSSSPSYADDNEKEDTVLTCSDDSGNASIVVHYPISSSSVGTAVVVSPYVGINKSGEIVKRGRKKKDDNLNLEQQKERNPEKEEEKEACDDDDDDGDDEEEEEERQQRSNEIDFVNNERDNDEDDTPPPRRSSRDRQQIDFYKPKDGNISNDEKKKEPKISLHNNISSNGRTSTSTSIDLYDTGTATTASKSNNDYRRKSTRDRQLTDYYKPAIKDDVEKKKQVQKKRKSIIEQQQQQQQQRKMTTKKPRTQQQQPKIYKTDEGQYWEIESVLDARYNTKTGKLEAYVKWMGNDFPDPEWVQDDSLEKQSYDDALRIILDQQQRQQQDDDDDNDDDNANINSSNIVATTTNVAGIGIKSSATMPSKHRRATTSRSSINRNNAGREKNQVPDSYHVQEILKRRVIAKGKVQYNIRWVGYPQIGYEDTWEPAENLNETALADAFKTFSTDTCNNSSKQYDDDDDDENNYQDMVKAKRERNRKKLVELGLAHCNNESFGVIDSVVDKTSANIASNNSRKNITVDGGGNDEDDHDDGPIVHVGSEDSNYYDSENDDYTDEFTDDQLDTIDLLSESDFTKGNGIPEFEYYRRTLRVGCFYFTDYQKECILQIKVLFPSEEMAECIKFIPSKYTFIHDARDAKSKEEYFQYGMTVKVPLSNLKKICKKKFPRSEWLYECDERKKFGCAYYKRTGSIPPSTPGKMKPNVLELFVGAGGVFLGFKNAGFEHKWAVDKNNAALSTLKANFNGSTVKTYNEDVRKFMKRSKLCDPAYPKKGEVDHISASPPCQGSSRANRTGGVNDEDNNRLSYELLEAVGHFEPTTATYENVTGFLQKKNVRYVKRLIVELMLMGYQVRWAVLDSSDYGDPQQRKRIIIFAANQDMQLPSIPEPTHGSGKVLKKRTVKDAIGILEDVEPFKGEDKGGSKSVNNVLVHNHCTSDCVPRPDDPTLNKHKPSRTIMGGSSQIIHYNKMRYLSVRECACLQSFPWEYQFFGSLGDQYKQVGNAVPVHLSTHIARSVAQVYGLP